MNKEKREIRTVQCKLSIREAGEGAHEESRIIQGTAIVFNAESEVLDDWGTEFREVILPEAATMEFLNTQDIKLNLLHERSMNIGRCNRGQGSMKIWVDEKGANFEVEAPKTVWGDFALEAIKRGDLTGCSFEFYPEDYDIEERDGGKEVKITHKKFRAITAFTLAMDPAYSQTTVNARELTPGNSLQLEKEKQQREAEKIKKENEARIARENEARTRFLQMTEAPSYDY